MTDPGDEEHEDLMPLAGLSLGKAYDVFVVNSEQVQKAIAEVRITNSDFLVPSNAIALIFKDGYWPLNIMKDKKAQRLMTQRQIVSGRHVRRSTWMAEFPRYLELNTGPGKVSGQRIINIPESVRVAYRTIFERYTQFLDLFLSNALSAEGRHKSGSKRITIPSIEWESELEVGRIGLIDNSFGLRSGTDAEPLYNALKINLPDCQGEASAIEDPIQKPSRKTGVPIAKFKEWFRIQVEEHTSKGERAKKEELRPAAESHFPGLSKNLFNEIWSELAPKEWKTGGRFKITEIKPPEKP